MFPHGHRKGTCLHLEEGRLITRKMLRNLLCLLTFCMCLVLWFISHIPDINSEGTVHLLVINYVSLLYK